MRVRSSLRTGVRPWAAFVIKFALGIGIVVACFTIMDVSALPHVLRRTDPLLFALALFLAILGTIGLPAMLTRRAVEINRINLSLAELVGINFAVRFYALVLPRAASIGVRWLRYRKGGSGHDALTLMIFERLVQLFVMMAVGTIVLAFERRMLGPESSFILALTASVTLLLAVAMTPFLFPAAAPWLARFSGLCDRLAPACVSQRMHKLLDAVQAFQKLRTGTSAYIVVLSLASYILFILSPYVIISTMDLHISLAALAWIRPIVFLMTLLPFTVGGVGVREAGFIGLLHLYGVASHEALALSLSLFAIQVMIGLVGAATELWRYGVAPPARRAG